MTHLRPSRRSLRPWSHPLLRLSRGSTVPAPFAHPVAPAPPHTPVLACTRSLPHCLRQPSHRPALSMLHNAGVPRTIHHSAHAIRNSQWATRLSPGPGCRIHARPARSPKFPVATLEIVSGLCTSRSCLVPAAAPMHARFPGNTGPAHGPNDVRTDPRVHTPLASHRRRPRSPRPHQRPTRPVNPMPPASAYAPPATT